MSLSIEAATLIGAGRIYRHPDGIGVASILTGHAHPVLQRAAIRHAMYQAEVQKQGHQNWDRRYQDLRKEMPGYELIEIANESWPKQSLEDAAKEMWRSWGKPYDWQNEGHWSVANGVCSWYGYSMALGNNKTWYAAGIVARKR